MMKFKDYRIFSVLNWTTTTFRIFDFRWEQALLPTSDPPSDQQPVARLQWLAILD